MISLCPTENYGKFNKIIVYLFRIRFDVSIRKLSAWTKFTHTHTHKKVFLWNRHFFICCLFIVFRKIRKIRHFLRSHSHRTHLFWLCPKEKPRKTLVISIIIATFICGCRLQPQIYQQFSFRVIILLLRITIELENLLQCQNGKRESSSSSWLNLWHRFSLYAHWPGVSPL